MNQNTIKSFYSHVMVHMLAYPMCSLRLTIIKIDNTWATFIWHMRVSAKDTLYFNVQIITPICKIKLDSGIFLNGGFTGLFLRVEFR